MTELNHNLTQVICNLEKESVEIKDCIASLTIDGHNLLQKFKTATMQTNPTIVKVEEDYQAVVSKIFHLNRSLKFIKKSIKHLEKSITL